MALTIPFTFVAGTAAVAAEVNSNFSAIATWANNANIGTDSLGILQARTVALPSPPTNAILYLNQTSSNQAIYISNAGTDSSLDIVQSGQLASGKGIIKITDNFTQTVSGANEFVMNLAANSTIPALMIKHGSVESFKLTKDYLRLEALLKPPVKTTVQRNAITSPEEGSVIYNSTTAQLNEKRNDGWAPVGSPVGSVQMFAGSAAPESWLLCDGSTLDSVANPKYAALFAVIGTTYGGTGATSFKVPDCRGIFVRGVGSQTIGAETYSATLGTLQNDATAKNGLTITDPGHNHTYTRSSSVDAGWGPYAAAGGANTNQVAVTTVTTGITLNAGDSETRPANIALNYIIKY